MRYSDTDYITEFGTVEKEMASLEKSLDDNLFIARNEVRASQTELVKLKKVLERMKVDYLKLQQP